AGGRAGGRARSRGAWRTRARQADGRCRGPRRGRSRAWDEVIGPVAAPLDEQHEGSGPTSDRSPGTFGFGDAGSPRPGAAPAPAGAGVPYEDVTSTELRRLLSNGSPPFRGSPSRRDPSLPIASAA